MLCPLDNVRKQIGSAIASIAAIEIPQGQWQELIVSLSNNCANEELQIKQAAIETLGFVCEELHPNDLSNEYKSLIIQGLTRNISPDPQTNHITKLSIQALYKGLPFARPNFEVSHERDFIMARIFDAL